VTCYLPNKSNPGAPRRWKLTPRAAALWGRVAGTEER